MKPFIKCNLVERGNNTGCISHSFFHSPFIVSCHGVKDNHRCTHSQSPLNQLTQCHIHLRLMTPGGRHTGIFSHGPRAHVFFWSCLHFLSVYWAGSPSRWTGSLRDYQHMLECLPQFCRMLLTTTSVGILSFPFSSPPFCSIL